MLWLDRGRAATIRSGCTPKKGDAMGYLTRFFDKKRAANATVAADLARSRVLSGQAIGQTGAEQASTRGRMEAELAGQRERREHPSAPVAPPCAQTEIIATRARTEQHAEDRLRGHSWAPGARDRTGAAAS
jgi:hypothetical protein